MKSVWWSMTFIRFYSDGGFHNFNQKIYGRWFPPITPMTRISFQNIKTFSIVNTSWNWQSNLRMRRLPDRIQSATVCVFLFDSKASTWICDYSWSVMMWENWWWFHSIMVLQHHLGHGRALWMQEVVWWSRNIWVEWNGAASYQVWWYHRNRSHCITLSYHSRAYAWYWVK